MVKYVDNEASRVSAELARVAPSQVGQTIRAIMERRGLSQVAIADFLGITQTAVSRWCVGRSIPAAENLTRLAIGLGVLPGFLLSYRPDMIASLTRAIRPAEFHHERDDVVVRQAERVEQTAAYVRRTAAAAEAAEKKEAARQRVAVRQQNAASIRAAAQAVQKVSEREHRTWLGRIAGVGDRCMVCREPLRVAGICASCMSGDRNND